VKKKEAEDADRRMAEIRLEEAEWSARQKKNGKENLLLGVRNKKISNNVNMKSLLKNKNEQRKKFGLKRNDVKS